MNPNYSNLLKRHPLVSFFILAYGIAWISLASRNIVGENISYGIASFAPAISAVTMAVASEGKAGIQALIAQLFLWRVNIKWYLIAVLAPIALELMAFLTHRLIGGAGTSVHFTDWIQTLPAQLPWLFIFLLFLVILSSGEELGWRGYAMPRLQAQCGPIGGSLILGLLWGFWHLPVFWIPGSVQYGLPVPGYVLATIGFTFIYTCIYNGTRGSVLLASLYHAASNLTLTYGNAISPEVINNLYLSLPALAILVMIVIILSGSSGFWGWPSFQNKDKTKRSVYIAK